MDNEGVFYRLTGPRTFEVGGKVLRAKRFNKRGLNRLMRNRAAVEAGDINALMELVKSLFAEGETDVIENMPAGELPGFVKAVLAAGTEA